MTTDLTSLSPSSSVEPSVQTPADTVQPQATEVAQSPEQQTQYFMELEDGSKYLTQEEAWKGLQEKGKYIPHLQEKVKLLERQLQMQEQLQQQLQMQAPPQAQVDPVEQLAQRLEPQLRQRFPNADEQSIKEQAIAQAIALNEQQQLLQQEQTKIQNQQFVESHKDVLYTPLAQELFNQRRMTGMPFRSPQEHLDAVHAEMFRRNMTAGHNPQPQATQQAPYPPQTSQFNFPQGSGAPQVPSSNPYVTEFLERQRQKSGGSLTPEREAKLRAIAEQAQKSFEKNPFRK